MIVIKCRAHMPKLGIANTFHLALPDEAPYMAHPLPYVVCLHDYGQNSERLLMDANWGASVDRAQTALLFPDGQNSCFINMVYGPAWETYLLEALLPYAERTFPLYGIPSLLGVGTGGWAAAQLAAKFPDRFAASAAVGGQRDLVQAYAAGELGHMPDLEAVLGDPAVVHPFPLDEKTIWLEGTVAAESALLRLLKFDGSLN